MTQLFDNRMAAGWKISFVLSVLWGAFFYTEAGGKLDDGWLLVYTTPLAIWFIARWIKVGKEEEPSE